MSYKRNGKERTGRRADGQTGGRTERRNRTTTDRQQPRDVILSPRSSTNWGDPQAKGESANRDDPFGAGRAGPTSTCMSVQTADRILRNSSENVMSSETKTGKKCGPQQKTQTQASMVSASLSSTSSILAHPALTTFVFLGALQ